jgi:hypothetical protein
MKINKQMKEDMVKTNKIINNKVQTLKSQRENDKKMEVDYGKFINSKSEALNQTENKRNNSYVQLMMDGLRRQMGHNIKKLDIEKKNKLNKELNSTGLNLPSYYDSKTTACSDCGTKYAKNMLTKIKK